MVARLGIAMWALAAAACSSGGSPTGGAEPPASQGIVAGVMGDSVGRGIPNAAVCATTAFMVSETPLIASNMARTRQNGSYVVPINLMTLDIDVQAGLTVAATPAGGSGLSPAYVSGQTIGITSAPPGRRGT